ncbi:phosphatase PAP2 family protein [Halalkalirubrum salinum]|uniref:phosphatase PAP2 family protein n=1 Tax=Halalkalirubrum salinum TaxID=2563889 RepID=UPI0010FB9A1B|nr:phosphatase PAP2 family protein [Halalkalirubrum salinum]
MGLVSVLTQVAIVIVSACLVASIAFIGPARLLELRKEAIPRLLDAKHLIAVLLVVLVTNGLIRDATQNLSWVFGWNITPLIRQIEGGVVIYIQSLATPLLTAYFSYIYVFGYGFLLIFPFLAYLSLSDQTHFRSLVLAYTLNYGLGLICYLIFIAYGPRNSFGPGLVESLLFDTYPQFQFLTRSVNVPTNVFPSLHTSLSATVALLAFHTRREYPIWLWISIVLAVSVFISTMYLGIHWLLDVIAGIVLAVVSVEGARRYVKTGSFIGRSSTADEPAEARS